MTFPLTMEVFNMENVFFFVLKNNVNTYYKRVIVATSFLSSTAQKTSLVVLIFFISLTLICGLLLNKYVNKGKVSELILFGVLILFFY